MTIHELSHYLRTQGIEVLSVVSRGRQVKCQVVEVGDIELGNNLEVEVDEDGTMTLAWWCPNDNQRVKVCEYTPTEVDELVKGIRAATFKGPGEGEGTVR
jgi:hypothetical protein